MLFENDLTLQFQPTALQPMYNSFSFSFTHSLTHPPTYTNIRTYSPRLHVIDSIINFIDQTSPIVNFLTYFDKIIGLFYIVQQHGFQSKAIVWSPKSKYLVVLAVVVALVVPSFFDDSLPCFICLLLTTLYILFLMPQCRTRHAFVCLCCFVLFCFVLFFNGSSCVLVVFL